MYPHSLVYAGSIEDIRSSLARLGTQRSRSRSTRSSRPVRGVHGCGEPRAGNRYHACAADSEAKRRFLMLGATYNASSVTSKHRWEQKQWQCGARRGQICDYHSV